jgi:hypothetical protein
MNTTLRLLWTVTAAGLIVTSTTPASAQWPVTDIAVTAKNAATAAQEQIRVSTQHEQYAYIRRMGRSLDVFRPLARYRMPGPPLLRTRWPEGLIPRARAYVDALNAGDAQGTGYEALLLPLHTGLLDDGASLGAMDASVTDTLHRQLGLIETLDAVNMSGTDLTGRVRGARKPYREALALYESEVTTPTTTTKIAGHLAVGTWLKAQQDHILLQLAIEQTRQAAIENLMEREAAAGGVVYALGAQLGAKKAGSRTTIDSPVNWVIH